VSRTRDSGEPLATSEPAQPDEPAAGAPPSPETLGLAREVAAGTRGLHQVPAALDARSAAAVRRLAAEERARGEGREVRLRHIASFSLDAERAASAHCENLIGAAQVPMGLVGPLRVRASETAVERDTELDFEVFVPLATTEGALLASVNRGCRALTAAGGVRVWVEDIGMTRAPVFATGGLEQSRRLVEWVAEHHEEIRAHAEKTSRYLRLLELLPQVVGGTTVLLRFRFATGDAMGMNMVTIACDRVVRELIEPATGVRCIALSGNFCVDKKPSAVNFLLGRGKRVVAEAVVPAEILRRTLKTTAAGLVEVTLRKNLHGSIAAGSLGYNAQFANVLAALFIATGQDLAHVVEGSMGLTHFEEREGGAAYASVTLPDLPVAAVGGGTGLATQREALQILGVVADAARPGAAARRLAAIAGAVVLAGELSLMSAFTSNDLARAHERLGRSKVDDGGGGSPGL
jgi:hydroxymethylglutaryl-CoA reductase (NADPH)